MFTGDLIDMLADFVSRLGLGWLYDNDIVVLIGGPPFEFLR